MLHDLIFLVTGIIVGVMNAIAGGGMLVGFPIMIALGLPALSANATSSIVNIPGQLTSAFVYRSYIKKAPRKFAWMLIPLVIGACFGALVMRNTPADEFAKLVPMLVLFGVALFAIQPYISKHLHGHLSASTKITKRLQPFWLLSLALLPMAFYAGYFGAGVGFMMLAVLSFTHVNNMHVMTGLKNVAATFMAAATAACLFSAGLINWHVAIVMAVGSIIGGWTGAHLSTHLPARWLRVAVCGIGFGAAIYLAIQNYK